MPWLAVVLDHVLIFLGLGFLIYKTRVKSISEISFQLLVGFLN